MHGRVFVLLEVLLFLSCFGTPISSLWLAPDWTWLVSILAVLVWTRVKVTIFLLLGDLLVLLSASVSLIIWWVRHAAK